MFHSVFYIRRSTYLVPLYWIIKSCFSARLRSRGGGSVLWTFRFEAILFFLLDPYRKNFVLRPCTIFLLDCTQCLLNEVTVATDNNYVHCLGPFPISSISHFIYLTERSNTCNTPYWSGFELSDFVRSAPEIYYGRQAVITSCISGLRN